MHTIYRLDCIDLKTRAANAAVLAVREVTRRAQGCRLYLGFKIQTFIFRPIGICTVPNGCTK